MDHPVGLPQDRVSPAPFTTRVVVRRPESAPASGTLVVEWLNVSSGADAAVEIPAGGGPRARPTRRRTRR